ncbi:hypothetical protein [Pseudomonas aeruginosa]|uniref:hypothetical protein n=1 Tax=Pseudomonas aeruginosa TaxID=287 RepID=UPI0003D3EF4B|nr:hypothetical protein [Pseudomonas aeruginosa]ETD53143.1 hypothetical protein X922_06710 [Pseudomonas aeruginosa VRFPA08]
MKNEYRFGYDEMLIQIQACVPDSQKGDGLPMTMARAQWISQVFVLCTLGNSLARDKGWRLWGMDAIEYALMRRYSWPLETIREMPIRDRWLALHEELADLQWDEEAQQVWLAKIEPVCTLGNSLARDKGWRLWGMDAIEYALMRRYSWPLETIREMPIRDRWLALHEELADLQWDEEAQQVWLAKIEPVLPGAPGTDYDVWRSDAPGFQLPQAPGYLVVR